MRHPFDPSPSREALAAREVHELIRDYPELLFVLRSLGVNVRECGTSRLSSVFPPGSDKSGEFLVSLAWRGAAGN